MKHTAIYTQTTSVMFSMIINFYGKILAKWTEDTKVCQLKHAYQAFLMVL